LLPDEIALVILSNLSHKNLLNCRLVSKRWQLLVDDSSLWRQLCARKGWKWKDPTFGFVRGGCDADAVVHSDVDDEGMGDEEDESSSNILSSAFDDSGFVPTESSREVNHGNFDAPASPLSGPPAPADLVYTTRGTRSSTPKNESQIDDSKGLIHPSIPNYKLLYLTRTLLHRRFLSGSYRLSYLQTRGSTNSHTSTIYCLQLYTYPDTGVQVLFTGALCITI
jgi:hypothetical protein